MAQLATVGSPICTHRTYDQFRSIFISTAVQLQFDNETPMVVGNSIFAEFSVSRSVETLDCRLAGLPRQNCKGGYLLAYM